MPYKTVKQLKLREPLYKDTDIRPESFDVLYSIDNRRWVKTVLLNQAGG